VGLPDTQLTVNVTVVLVNVAVTGFVDVAAVLK